MIERHLRRPADRAALLRPGPPAALAFLLGGAIAWGAAGEGRALSAAEPPPNRAPVEKGEPPPAGTVDLVFAGGSAAEYVEAIRSASGVLNVLVAPDAALVHIEPVELRRVGVESALYLLDDLRQERGDRLFELRVTSIPSADSATTSPVYRLDAKSAPRGGAGEGSRVWSIADLLESDLEPEDVLTAIETTLDLFDEGHVPAQLRFHRETALLIARGHPEQLAAIQSIIEELAGALSRARAERDSATEIVKLRGDVAESRSAIERLTLELTEARTRIELVTRAAEQGEVEAESVRRRCEDMISEAERRVRDLEAAIAASRAEKPR